jgi:hypothetical protein
MRLSERVLHVRRLLRAAEQGQPTGGAEAAGGELPERLVLVGRGLRKTEPLRPAAAPSAPDRPALPQGRPSSGFPAPAATMKRAERPVKRGSLCAYPQP